MYPSFTQPFRCNAVLCHTAASLRAACHGGPALSYTKGVARSTSVSTFCLFHLLISLKLPRKVQCQQSLFHAPHAGRKCTPATSPLDSKARSTVQCCSVAFGVLFSKLQHRCMLASPPADYAITTNSWSQVSHFTQHIASCLRANERPISQIHGVPAWWADVRQAPMHGTNSKLMVSTCELPCGLPFGPSVALLVFFDSVPRRAWVSWH